MRDDHCRMKRRLVAASKAAVEDVLAERRVFIVPGEVWDRFAVALDRPAADVPGLAELMNTPTVLDAG